MSDSEATSSIYLSNISLIKKGITVQQVSNYSLATVIFLMFIAPRAFQDIKILLLAVVVCLGFCTFCLTRRLYIHPIIFGLFVYYFTLGLLYSSYGYYNDNLGAKEVTKEMVVYPFYYFIIIASCINNNFISKIHSTLVLAYFFIAIYTIITLLNHIGYYPDWLYINIFESYEEFQSISTKYLESRGIFEVEIIMFTSLMFLQPYMLSYFVLKQQQTSKVFQLAIVLNTIIMFYSLVGILMLINLITLSIVFIFYVIKSFKGKIRKKYFVTLSGIIIFISLMLRKYGIQFYPYIVDLLNKFSVVPRAQYNARFFQIEHLFYGWLEKPLFGHGFGAVQWDSIRSIDQPWKYEITYSKFLYDVGIVGVLFYAAGLFITFKLLVKIYRRSSEINYYALSSLWGCCGFLIGAGTNPYLFRFDSLIVIFFPVMIINAWLLGKRGKGLYGR